MWVADTIAILLVLGLLGYFLYVVHYALGLYGFYSLLPQPPLTRSEQNLIARYFPVYGRLTGKERERFDGRIVRFRSGKRFIFYGEVAKKDELKLLLSASAVFLTFGLKDFMMQRSLLRIVVYPSRYYSRISRSHHFGEYNPRYKTAVFTATGVWNGFDQDDDNEHLAIHEFGHALWFHMLKRNSWEARRFKVGVRGIQRLLGDPQFVGRMETSGYFREYGMVNLQEFFSVVLENFVETPDKFQNEFPKLYGMIREMLQFDFAVDRERPLPARAANAGIPTPHSRTRPEN